MTNNKPNNYFDSINEFLNNGSRLLVLHEPNINDNISEEFFLLLNKKSINSNLENIFDSLNTKSQFELKALSKPTQLYITSKSDIFFFIHLTSMSYEKDKRTVNEDIEYISNNFKDVLITAYPSLNEAALMELSGPRVRSVKRSDNFESFQKISENAFSEIKKDTEELVNFTKKLIDSTSQETAKSLQKKIESSKPIVEQKFLESKDKLFQISASLKESFLKQKKIISKMK